MFLATCIKEGEDDLVCDLAEYYGIYDYKSMSPMLIATLTAGLREDSRTMLRIAGCRISCEKRLLALITDNTALLLRAYIQAHSKKRAPEHKSIFGQLMGIEEKKETDTLKSFDSPDDFENYWKKRVENA